MTDLTAPSTAVGVDATLNALPSVPSPTRTAEASGLMTRAADVARIRSTVEHFQRAYDALDANAAREVWPSLRVDQLSRAFAALKSQSLTFDRCAIEHVTTRVASVSCGGSTRFVPRVGRATPIVQTRQWRFTLRQVDADWLIETVDVSP